MATLPDGLSVAFWSRRYPPNYLYHYRMALRKISPEERLGELWEWKMINHFGTFGERYIEE